MTAPAVYLGSGPESSGPARGGPLSSAKSSLNINQSSTQTASASLRAITGTESPGFRRVQTSRDPLRKSPRVRREGRRGTPLLLKIRLPVKPPGSRWPLQHLSVLPLPPKPRQPLLRSPPVARPSVPAAPPPRPASPPGAPTLLPAPAGPAATSPPPGPPPPAAQQAGPSPGRSSLAGPSRAPGAETTPGGERGHARSAAASHLSEGAAAAGAGAGARSAFDRRGEEGGGRARFIIGDGGGHL